jgi:hypothetical protein
MELAERLNIKKTLHATDRKRGKATTCPLLISSQFHAMLNNYLKKLGTAIQKQLSKSVFLEYNNDSSTDFGSEMVLIQLRVFQSPLQIIIPQELAHDLGAYVLEKEPGNILKNPSTDEVTAIGYFAAKVLAEEQLFSAQRIYITGTKVVTHLDELDSLDFILSIKVNVDGFDYAIQVLLGASIYESIKEYAELYFESDSKTSYLHNVETKWQIIINYQVGAITFLKHIGEGTKFTIPSNPVSVRLDGNGKIHGTLLPSSKPGLFKIQLASTN